MKWIETFKSWLDERVESTEIDKDFYKKSPRVQGRLTAFREAKERFEQLQSPSTEVKWQQGVEAAIEEFLSKSTDISHSHYNNELMYGYCNNGSYELSTIDVKELAEHIENNTASQPKEVGQDELWDELVKFLNSYNSQNNSGQMYFPMLELKSKFTLIKK